VVGLEKRRVLTKDRVEVFEVADAHSLMKEIQISVS
jgi:hypothetical protein